MQIEEYNSENTNRTKHKSGNIYGRNTIRKILIIKYKSESTIRKYKLKITNRKVQIGEIHIIKYKYKKYTRQSQNAHQEILIAKYRSEDTNRKIKIRKYETEHIIQKHKLGNTNRIIQFGRYA